MKYRIRQFWIRIQHAFGRDIYCTCDGCQECGPVPPCPQCGYYHN